MGYTTWFEGSLKFNKEVTTELREFINKFANIKHMRRDIDKLKEKYPNWESQCYKEELGCEGEYFIGCKSGYNDESVIDYNKPPVGVPGLWCQWIIDKNGELAWDGGEKFYSYVEWLEYLIFHFFEDEGYVLNGEIKFQGESSDDRGRIVVTDNEVEILYESSDDLEDYDDEYLITELERRGYTVTYI